MITALGRLTQEDQEFRSSLSNRMVDRVMLIYITSAPREPRQEDRHWFREVGDYCGLTAGLWWNRI